MVIKESGHCYYLDDNEIKEHDEFIKKHEKCICDGQTEKFSYYERPAGFSNWFGLHIRCNVCGENKVISGDDFDSGEFDTFLLEEGL